jgi:hypothetical protein
MHGQGVRRPLSNIFFHSFAPHTSRRWKERPDSVGSRCLARTSVGLRTSDHVPTGNWMNSILCKPLMCQQFLRSKRGRVIIALALVACVLVFAIGSYPLLDVVFSYQREQRISSMVQKIGGTTRFQYAGPEWIPYSIRKKVALFDRIEDIRLPSGSVPAELQAEIGTLTNLKLLCLRDTDFGDLGLESLRQLHNLESLNLKGTKVSDQGLTYLKGLTRLNDLVLSSTTITDAGLVNLKGLTRLDVLNLDRTNVTDAGLIPLKDLSRLTELGLAGTHVTDSGLDHLKGLKHLRALRLSGSQTTSEGRTGLCRVMQISTITPALGTSSGDMPNQPRQAVK